MSVAEIAEQLSRSKAWVSLRLGLIAQLTPVVSEAWFAGDFPVCAFLYSLRPFRRLPDFPPADIDLFVQAFAVEKLSVREIEGLAHGFFRGPESFRAEVLKGNLCLPLRQWSNSRAIRTAAPSSNGSFCRISNWPARPCSGSSPRARTHDSEPPFFGPMPSAHRRAARPGDRRSHRSSAISMIAPEKRKAIFLLHQEGMPPREISRRLFLSRNSVRRVIAQEGRLHRLDPLPHPPASTGTSCANSISSATDTSSACMKSSRKNMGGRSNTPP